MLYICWGRGGVMRVALSVPFSPFDLFLCFQQSKLEQNAQSQQREAL